MDLALASLIFTDIQAIRKESPLILNITNFVSADFVANALLALGASPVMSQAPEEVAELVQIAKAVVLNPGTLTNDWIALARAASTAAKFADKPQVLDPVGAGASALRTTISKALLENTCIVRGNASEILTLAQGSGTTKGVDSALSPDAILEAAQGFAQEKNLTVTVSGKTDYIFSETKVAKLENGHALMAKVTGMGCVSTAIVGAFRAVNASAFQASVNAMAVMGICGEIAFEKAGGPGSFRTTFLDALYSLKEEQIQSRLKATLS